MRNRVFRCIENRARGFIGLLAAELIAGLAVFVVLVTAGNPLVGIGLGAAAVAALAAWRRRDHDRSDYAMGWWRRMTAKERIYSPLGSTSERR